MLEYSKNIWNWFELTYRYSPTRRKNNKVTEGSAFFRRRTRQYGENGRILSKMITVTEVSVDILGHGISHSRVLTAWSNDTAFITMNLYWYQRDTVRDTGVTHYKELYYLTLRDRICKVRSYRAKQLHHMVRIPGYHRRKN